MELWWNLCASVVTVALENFPNCIMDCQEGSLAFWRSLICDRHVSVLAWRRGLLALARGAYGGWRREWRPCDYVS